MPSEEREECRFVFSDLHLGEGKDNHLEHFEEDQIFAAAIETILKTYANRRKVLVLLGDTFDFLSVEYRGKVLAEPTEEAALEKLKKIFAAHPLVVEAFQKFLADGKIKFFVGNHDLDLRWPSVQLAIKRKLAAIFTSAAYFAATERVEFAEEELKDGVFFIHGSNGEAVNALPEEHFLTSHLWRPLPEPLLNIPYGNHLAADLANRLARGSRWCKGNRWVNRLEPHWYIYAESIWKNQWFGLYAALAWLLMPLRHSFSRRWWVRKSASLWALFRANFEAMILTAINLLRGRDHTHYPIQLLKDNPTIEVIFIGHIHEFRYMKDKRGTIVYPGNWCTTYDVRFPIPVLKWKRWRFLERLIKFFWAMRRMFLSATRHLHEPKKRQVYSFGICRFYADGQREIKLMRYNPEKNCVEELN